MEQADLLKFAVQVLERIGIRYALVGAFASGVWGESRFTQDIDLLIEIKADQVPALFGSFPEPDFYVRRTSAQTAIAHGSQSTSFIPLPATRSTL